jgi:hypothetical protein
MARSGAAMTRSAPAARAITPRRRRSAPTPGEEEEGQRRALRQLVERERLADPRPRNVDVAHDEKPSRRREETRGREARERESVPRLSTLRMGQVPRGDGVGAPGLCRARSTTCAHAEEEEAVMDPYLLELVRELGVLPVYPAAVVGAE